MQFGYENVKVAIITSHGIEWRSYNYNNDRGKVETYPKIQNIMEFHILLHQNVRPYIVAIDLSAHETS